MEEKELTKVVCPHCGYRLPIFVNKDYSGKGIFVKCKNKKCNKIIQIGVDTKK